MVAIVTASKIHPLRIGERMTIYVRRLPLEMSFHGLYAGRSWWGGRWFLDLAIEGQGLMGLELEHVYGIERYETATVTCGM